MKHVSLLANNMWYKIIIIKKEVNEETNYKEKKGN